MKSTHNKAEQQQPKEIKYPCLMVSTWGDVVLFSKPNIGVKLVVGQGLPIGYYSGDFCMHEFTPLPSTESITLQND